MRTFVVAGIKPDTTEESTYIKYVEATDEDKTQALKALGIARRAGWQDTRIIIETPEEADE